MNMQRPFGGWRTGAQVHESTAGAKVRSCENKCVRLSLLSLTCSPRLQGADSLIPQPTGHSQAHMPSSSWEQREGGKEILPMIAAGPQRANGLQNDCLNSLHPDCLPFLFSPPDLQP